MAEFRLETERLILREWREADIEPFWQLSQNPEAMRYLGPMPDRDSIAQAVAGQRQNQQQNGVCFWAVERRADCRFVGYCGLAPAKPPFEGEVEIGWRLERAAWGQGYAREAAQASLDWAWANLKAQQVIAITVPANERSWGLMKRLGMRRDVTGDFDHPDLVEGDPLRRHVLYRIGRPT